MSDLITRARKEWCEADLVEFDEEGREIPIEYVCCPPEVVAALLDVLENLVPRDARMSQTGKQAVCALAAIAKALEQQK